MIRQTGCFDDAVNVALTELPAAVECSIFSSIFDAIYEYSHLKFCLTNNESNVSLHSAVFVLICLRLCALRLNLYDAVRNVKIQPS